MITDQDMEQDDIQARVFTGCHGILSDIYMYDKSNNELLSESIRNNYIFS